MMHDSYWFGYSVTDLLFKGLNIQSVGGFIFVCLLLMVSAGLFEGVKLCQITVKLKALLLLAPRNLNLFCFSNDQSSLLNNGNGGTSVASRSRISLFICEVILYMGQALIGFIFMLIVMTFNAYFTISLAAGAGIGYFLFGFQCDQAKLKMVKLKVPCQHCLQNNRDDSAASTLVENESVAGSSHDTINRSPQLMRNSTEAEVDIHSPNVLPS